MKIRIAIVGLLALGAAAAEAGQLDLRKLPGAAMFTFASPRNLTEVCIQSKAFPGYEDKKGVPGYDKDDLKKEAELCLFDFYRSATRDPAVQNIAVCPKTFSTNPALEVHGMPAGVAKAAYEASECKKAKARAGDKLAKFKNSISCSYTPSILGYYHLGRVLDIGRIPNTVIRTMDVAGHIARAKEGVLYAQKSYGRGSLLDQIWSGFVAVDNAGARSKYFTQVFTTDAQQIYGALAVNPGGEALYSEINGTLAGDRVANFQRTQAFSAVSYRKALATLNLPKQFTQATAQYFRRVKDTGDLILLDTLMNQQDRFGNLHYQPAYAWLENGKVEYKKAKSEDPAKMPPELSQKGAVIVRRMLMKDNDCGVVKTNKMKVARILERVTHLAPKTYKRFMWLWQQVQKPEVQAYLQNELLFTAYDVKLIVANINEAGKLLSTKCNAGTLFLDVDLEQHLSTGLPQSTKDKCALQ